MEVIGSKPIVGSTRRFSEISITVARLPWEQNAKVRLLHLRPPFNGPIVQWQNASFATRKPEFDSRRVHHFQWADSSTVEHLNGIEKMAVQFRPCPPCFQDGRVAQLDRVLGYEPRGCEFESRLSQKQTFKWLTPIVLVD